MGGEDRGWFRGNSDMEVWGVGGFTSGACAAKGSHHTVRSTDTPPQPGPAHSALTIKENKTSGRARSHGPAAGKGRAGSALLYARTLSWRRVGASRAAIGTAGTRRAPVNLRGIT